MQATGHSKKICFYPILICTLFILMGSCANQSSQSSGRQQASDSNRNQTSTENSKTGNNEESTYVDQYANNPLDNRETQAVKDARLIREAEACVEKDAIKNVEVIVNGIVRDDIDITNHYTSGTLYDDAKTVSKETEEEIDAENPPETPPEPPSLESSTESGLKVTLYKRPVYSVIPAPVFKFSLTGASTDSGIKVDLNEKDYPLLNGFGQKVEIVREYEGSLGISDLAKVFISKKKQQFQVIDLNEAFQRNPGEDREQLKIDELHVRQIIKVTLKVNGRTIYQVDDVNHVIALHPGEDEGLSYKNEWADLDMKSNKTFQQYLNDFNECTAPLAE